MLEIDGSSGEGGGQVVRTSLALAMCTGTAVTINAIRAHRDKPGLRAQHLAAVRAAALVCGARVTGATTASRTLSFEPGPVRPGRYEIDVGTAGSTMLVFETILPPLSLCSAPSQILLRGGTHNPRAPTFEFVRDAYLPLLATAGFKAHLTLERHGFFPKGGGVVRAVIEPFRSSGMLEVPERGEVRTRSANILLSRLPEHIGQREARVLCDRLDLPQSACVVETVTALGPGNALNVRMDCTHITAVFAGFGMRGVPAEKVAGDLADTAARYLEADVAVDRYLADQILLPLALTTGGRFSTPPPSSHTETNAAVMRKFIPLVYMRNEIGPGRWMITLRRHGSPDIPGARSAALGKPMH